MERAASRHRVGAGRRHTGKTAALVMSRDRHWLDPHFKVISSMHTVPHYKLISRIHPGPQVKLISQASKPSTFPDAVDNAHGKHQRSVDASARRRRLERVMILVVSISRDLLGERQPSVTT